MVIHFNNTAIDIAVNDESYRSRSIKGDDNLTVYFSKPEHIDIPVGAWTEFESQRYELLQPENFKKNGTRNFEYTLIMESEQAKLKKYKFRDTTSRKLKFSYTAQPQEHIKMLVDNMNQRESGWTVGECVESVEKVLSYNHNYCWDALNQIAEAFDTEWEIVGKKIHLRKVEYNKDNPLPLSYGRGNGFKPGLGRTNYDESNPVEILFVQGGERNIDPSKYGSQELLLPKNQQLDYEGHTYQSDADGFSIRRTNKPLQTLAEDSLDCSNIYPSRVGTVSSVIVVDVDNHFYDFIDNSIPANLDFSQYRIDGEKMTVIFQSGMLAGKEFDLEQTDKRVTGYVHSERRFKLVPQEIDGRTMPDNIYKPVAGDKYAVFGMMMPDEYICDNATQTGASWDMFREAAKYLYEHEEPRFSFTGELDGIWAKKDWLNIGGKIKLGGYVLFTDNQFQTEGVLIRIINIKDYINNPHSPVIELSNITIGGTVAGELRKIDENEVYTEDLHKNALQFTKRRFRDSLETIGMLEDALLDKFTNSINPIAIQTMAMLVGDESLQFRFVNSKTNPVEVSHTVSFNPSTRILTSSAGIIQHMTLGITDVSSGHKVNEYKFWDIPVFNTPPLTDDSKKYYLYAKVSATGTAGTFYISETAISMNAVANYYHLLVGILNSAYDGERSYVDLYGFTEILPGQITVNRVVSSDGLNFIDFLNNAFRVGNNNTYLDFNTSKDGKLRLKGTLVQSESGAEQPLGCFRGEYNPDNLYYNGDESTYEGSTYRFIYNSPQQGKVPTNTTYWVVVASKGTDGVDGAYFEYRYAKSGSTTAPPALTVTSADPSGWTTSMPSVNALEYLWLTVAKKSSAGALLQNWSTPIRTSGVKGDKGDKGDNPALVFRGEYSSTETYYGTSTRIDCVEYNEIYYVARVDAGNGFSNKVPTDITKWNTFGAQFDSVATNLLLVEDATIGDWSIKDGKITSQQTISDNSPKAQMNGNYGGVAFNTDVVYTDAYGNPKTAIAKLELGSSERNDTNSSLWMVTDNNYITLLNEKGLLVYGSGHGCGSADDYPQGYRKQRKASIYGISSFGYGDNWECTIGVYGTTDGDIDVDKNNGGHGYNPCPSYGGYFNNLLVAGLNLYTKILNNSNNGYHADEYDTFISCYNTQSITIYFEMPKGGKGGKTYFIRSINAAVVLDTYTFSGVKILNSNNNEVNTVSVSRGTLAILIWDGVHWLIHQI